jgi:hypothetical protein
MSSHVSHFDRTSAIIFSTRHSVRQIQLPFLLAPSCVADGVPFALVGQQRAANRSFFRLDLRMKKLRMYRV